ncbi:MAG: C40 family peptidase [Treponema sp.]|nr:C40 family peptidase [Treponema sp.]
MKPLFFVILVLCSASLFAAPLEGGYSMTLVSSDARDKVINAAVKYENTPYRYGGMANSGIDCSGLICLSFKDALGVTLPRSASALYTWAEKIPDNKAQPGDLLFFKTDATGKISHVGLYMGNNQFIHAASSGEKTGVIYSNLGETYWSNTYAGAGRAFPEASSGYRYSSVAAAGTKPGSETAAPAAAPPAVLPAPSLPVNPSIAAASDEKSGRLLLGAAIAPTWVGFLKGGDLFRGFAAQLFLTAETRSFGPKMLFGLEIRPEYDGALGVFRLPVTLSWGLNEKIMIFAGPVFSFGDASLSTEDGERSYSGGTSWMGAAGITAAPVSFKTAAAGDFAPYFEAAWQYYYSDSNNRNPNADFSAGFRFSTGLKWTIQVR